MSGPKKSEASSAEPENVMVEISDSVPLRIVPLRSALNAAFRVIVIDPLADRESVIHTTVTVPLADMLAFLDSVMVKRCRPVSEYCLLTLVVLFPWRLYVAEILCAADAEERRVSTSNDVIAIVSGFAVLVSLGAFIFRSLTLCLPHGVFTEHAETIVPCSFDTQRISTGKKKT